MFAASHFGIAEAGPRSSHSSGEQEMAGGNNYRGRLARDKFLRARVVGSVKLSAPHHWDLLWTSAHRG